MPEAYIVEAVRSPVGKKKGGLSKVHPADLGAHVIKGLVERTGIDPGVVDDVVFGCVDTVATQAGDVARTCWLAAGYPEACREDINIVDRDTETQNECWEYGGYMN